MKQKQRNNILPGCLSHVLCMAADIEHIDDRVRRTIQEVWQVRGSVAAASGLRETRLREGVATSKSRHSTLTKYGPIITLSNTRGQYTACIAIRRSTRTK
jgi:hypothetical protein